MYLGLFRSDTSKFIREPNAKKPLTGLIPQVYLLSPKPKTLTNTIAAF
jgi:hypothetical protein